MANPRKSPKPAAASEDPSLKKGGPSGSESAAGPGSSHEEPRTPAAASNARQSTSTGTMDAHDYSEDGPDTGTSASGSEFRSQGRESQRADWAKEQAAKENNMKVALFAQFPFMVQSKDANNITSVTGKERQAAIREALNVDLNRDAQLTPEQAKVRSALWDANAVLQSGSATAIRHGLHSQAMRDSLQFGSLAAYGAMMTANNPISDPAKLEKRREAMLGNIDKEIASESEANRDTTPLQALRHAVQNGDAQAVTDISAWSSGRDAVKYSGVHGVRAVGIGEAFWALGAASKENGKPGGDTIYNPEGFVKALHQDLHPVAPGSDFKTLTPAAKDSAVDLAHKFARPFDRETKNTFMDELKAIEKERVGADVIAGLKSDFKENIALLPEADQLTPGVKKSMKDGVALPNGQTFKITSENTQKELVRHMHALAGDDAAKSDAAAAYFQKYPRMAMLAESVNNDLAEAGATN